MYDVIIVGGRCAGSATAMLLARKGHRVLVVDRSTFPSDVLSTHFLWPHGVSYLNRWGLADQVLATTPSHTELTIVTEGIPLTGTIPVDALRSYFVQQHGDDHGVVQRYASVRRRVLDSVLVDAAVAAGVEFRSGVNVEGLLRDETTDAVVGITGRTRQGTPVAERATVVVGADGRNSLVARTLGLSKYDERPRCTFAYWTYFEGFDLRTARLHRRGRLGMAVVPTNFGQNMTLVWGPSHWATGFRRDIEGNFHRALEFVAPQVAEVVRDQGQRAERFYGTLDQSAFLRPLHGPGWVLVGDAECAKDQCTATGMTHAFRDAELASSALHEWLSGRASQHTALAGYERARRSQAAAAYYDHVATLAEMRPARHDELRLLTRLQDDQVQADRFLATHGDIVPVSEFFDPANLFLLNDNAGRDTREHAVFTDFEHTYRAYQQSPFEHETVGGYR